MTRVAVFLALVLAALAGPAAAQSITVRSGEHASFSRLVFEFAALPDWQLTRLPEGYELRLAEPGPGYDLRNVFRFIPRTRIRALSQDGGTGILTLRMGCACHADAFVHRGTNLVIDIRDGPAPSGSPFEQVFVAALPDQAAPPVEPEPLPDGFSARLSEPGTETPLSLSQPFLDQLAGDMERRGAFPGVDADPKDETESRPVAPPIEASTALVEALGRAAGQGLIDADVAALTPRVPMREPRTAEHRTRPDLPATPEPGTLPEQGANIRVQTRIDLDLERIAPGLRARLGDGVCLETARLNLPAWGDASAPGRDLGAYRGALAAARDRPDPAAVTNLARHYLFLSFGQEARALLAAYPGLAEDEALLESMARLIGGEELVPPHPLEAQAGCPGPAALWGLLAEGNAETGVAAPSVIAAFSALPLHLRRHLGPEVSRRLLTLGDTASAAAVLNAIGRAPGDHGDAIALADALVSQAMRPEDDAAGAALAPLIQAAPPIAAEATLLMIEDALEAGGAVPADLVETAGVFAFEFAGHEMAAQLKEAEIRALSRNGAHLDAFAALDRALSDGVIAPDRGDALRVGAYRAAASTAPDAEIGVLALSALSELGEEGAALSARRELAARLIGLGLSDLALSTLPIAPSRGVEDRLLAARAHLAAGDPMAAEREIAGLGGEGIAPIRAEILAAMGRHDRAAEIFETLDAPERTLQEAIMSRSWERITAVAPTGMSEPVAALARRRDGAAGSDPARETLLSDAAELRAGLTVFLEATALTE